MNTTTCTEVSVITETGKAKITITFYAMVAIVALAYEILPLITTGQQLFFIVLLLLYGALYGCAISKLYGKKINAAYNLDRWCVLAHLAGGPVGWLALVVESLAGFIIRRTEPHTPYAAADDEED